MKQKTGPGLPRPEKTQRQLRVGEMIRHALVETFIRGELRDPTLIDVSLTVAEVRVSPDLRSATAFVMPLGGNNAEEIIRALNHASPFLRRKLAKVVTLRYVPSLFFAVDDSFDRGQKIENILKTEREARDFTEFSHKK